jgi:hypothetical protein
MPVVYEAALMLSLDVLVTISRVLVPSVEVSSSTAEGAIDGTAIAKSFGFFFNFLMLSSSLSSDLYVEELAVWRGSR